MGTVPKSEANPSTLLRKVPVLGPVLELLTTSPMLVTEAAKPASIGSVNS